MSKRGTGKRKGASLSICYPEKREKNCTRRSAVKEEEQVGGGDEKKVGRPYTR